MKLMITGSRTLTTCTKDHFPFSSHLEWLQKAHVFTKLDLRGFIIWLAGKKVMNILTTLASHYEKLNIQ